VVHRGDRARFTRTVDRQDVQCRLALLLTALRSERERAPVRAPGRVAVEIASGHRTRRGGTVGRGEPDLGEVLVLAHVDAADHERDGRTVGRHGRALGLDDVADDSLGDRGVRGEVLVGTRHAADGSAMWHDPQMEIDEFLAALDRDSAAFADACAAAGPGAEVAGCPGWTVADLLWHVTEVQDFWRTIVAEKRASWE